MTDNRRQAYIYGNTVRKPQELPGYGYAPQRREAERPRRSHKRSQRIQTMTSGYVLFLAVAAIVALVVCIGYLQLQSQITTRVKNIAALQAELTSTKDANDTKEAAIEDSVDLDSIQKIAQDKLGMVEASEKQIKTYDSPTSDYVKQYEEIPEDGVLAKSADTGK